MALACLLPDQHVAFDLGISKVVLVEAVGVCLPAKVACRPIEVLA